ncbi:hypothetical protein [Micromonospora antibiotica]|uniref:Uncharacterized protein n=1 Tax=Micromonospora antibiotica TaxID=2807623 RepID=A0ABS3VHB4_9ACTN|nr:hypothetical protein [Micromonospora antibiotica]MBO4165036.1 hypothetical protein [Micromonospora antibiotica]
MVALVVSRVEIAPPGVRRRYPAAGTLLRAATALPGGLTGRSRRTVVP